MSAFSQVALVVFGITIFLTIIGWVGLAMNMPINLPAEIYNAVHYLFSGLRTLDFAIPITTLLQNFFLILSLRVAFFVVTQIIRFYFWFQSAYAK